MLGGGGQRGKNWDNCDSKTNLIKSHLLSYTSVMNNWNLKLKHNTIYIIKIMKYLNVNPTKYVQSPHEKTTKY